ncbi:MAG: GNAT family N-acetyltransferase [Acidimicrobiales bacterium]
MGGEEGGTTRATPRPVVVDHEEGYQVLEGRLVRLRLVEETDIRALAEIRRAPEVHRHWRGGTDMVKAVEKDLAEPDATAYAIELAGRVVGYIQWQAEEDPDYRHASIDIYVDPGLHGRGVGTDAVRTVVRHLVVDHGHHRVVIDPAVDNPAAIRSYTKVGFRPVGVMRQAERGNDGTWHDALLMDLLAIEFLASDGLR